MRLKRYRLSSNQPSQAPQTPLALSHPSIRFQLLAESLEHPLLVKPATLVVGYFDDPADLANIREQHLSSAGIPLLPDHSAVVLPRHVTEPHLDLLRPSSPNFETVTFVGLHSVPQHEKVCAIFARLSFRSKDDRVDIHNETSLGAEVSRLTGVVEDNPLNRASRELLDATRQVYLALRDEQRRLFPQPISYAH